MLRAAEMLRAEAAGDADLLQLIDRLIADIRAANRRIEDLEMDLKSLRDQLPPPVAMPTPEPPACGANEVLRGGACVCEDGYQRSGDMCEKVPPPAPTCGANEELRGGACVCEDGYQRSGDMCEMVPPPPPTCGANEELRGGVCVCKDGYQRNGDICEKVPPPPTCGANEELRGGVCVCEDGYRRSGDMCERIPTPQPPAATVTMAMPPPTCGAHEKLREGKCVCRNILGNRFERRLGVCGRSLPSFDLSRAEVTLPSSWTAAEQQEASETMAEVYSLITMLPPETASHLDMTLFRFSLLTSSVKGDITIETFRARMARMRRDMEMLAFCADCTYDTFEFRRSSGAVFMGALYAYEQGYHGQGVTVVNAESVLASHEELRDNVLTMDIGLDCSDHWRAIPPGNRQDNARIDFTTYGCDNFAVNHSVWPWFLFGESIHPVSMPIVALIITARQAAELLSPLAMA